MDARPNSGGGNDSNGVLGMFTYNAFLLCNKKNEEFYPTMVNPDYMSIHTYRKYHGVVDFYLPLTFFFNAGDVK